jgi:hypothetical protein
MRFTLDGAPEEGHFIWTEPFGSMEIGEDAGGVKGWVCRKSVMA